MDELQFSVLMAVYAKENPTYFRESLQSVAGQIYPATQVVVVCDGPLTPELDDVLASFESVLPLTIVRLEQNRGLAAALNEGLQHCRAAWIARFDSDDLCEPERLIAQRNYLLAHPEVDVIGSAILEFESEPQSPYAYRRVPTSHDDIARQAKRRNPLNHMTVAFRRQSIINVGGYPTDYLYEDYCLWVKLLVSGARFANIPDALVRARAGDSMINRRGGWSYVRSEIRAQTNFWRAGFLSTPQFVFNVGVRTAVRLAPAKLRRFIYHSTLRHATLTGGKNSEY
jgi:glycosyltransferase involved in cell wall biosynthesis